MSFPVTLHPFANLPFLLVSGQARSGTTVLTRAIAQHPSIHSNQKESNYIRDLAILLGIHTRPARQSQLCVEADAFREHFRQTLLHVLFPLHETSADTPQCISTFSSLKRECLDSLAFLFPDLWVANIVRNGVEVVSSRMVHPVIGQRRFDEHCRAWAAAREMAEWGRSQEGYFEVRHEQLLKSESTQQMFQRMFDHFGLTYSESPTSFVHAGLFNNTKTKDESDQEAADLTRRHARWRGWTKEQRSLFEAICGSTMEFFGYPIPW